MRRFLFLSALIISGVFLTPTPTLAEPVPLSQSSPFVPLAPIPGLTQGVTANSAGTTTFLNNLYKFLIGIAAVLAVLEIMWGGFQYATQDSVSKKGEGKKRIQQAFFGLALVLLPILVFGIINPQILNLSIGMGPLNVQSTAGYVAPVTLPADTNCNTSSCVANYKADCESKGGVYSNTGANGSTAGDRPTCYLANQNATAGAQAISSAQCATLVGHGTPGTNGFQPTQHPASEAQNCDASTVAMLKASDGQSFCKNLSGGGVCLYSQ